MTVESLERALRASLVLVASLAAGASGMSGRLATSAYANGEGAEHYSRWLTAADVEKVTGVKGIQQRGSQFHSQEGEGLVTLTVYEGEMGRGVWQGRSRGLPQTKLRKIAGLGDEGFEEDSGIGLSIWVRQGRYVISVGCGAVLKGNALVPRLSSGQLRALAKIVLANSQKPPAREPAAPADAPGEEARYARLLTPADIEKVTGLKGIAQDGFEFLRQDGEPVVSFALYEGAEAQSVWPGRSDAPPGVGLRKIGGIGDEALEEDSGSGLALWVRKGRQVIKVESGSVEKGNTVVPSLSPQQVHTLAKIALGRM